jgi:outer membrane protein OmpA-like peptidoglycan-associated protein
MNATEFELLGELEEGLLEGELEEEAWEIEPIFPRDQREGGSAGPSTLPDPPVDKDPVSGCTLPGKPFDDFEFGSPAVPAKHELRIKQLAEIIVNSWVNDPSLGIRTVCLEGHTDWVGPADVNKRLGHARASNLRDKLRQAIFDEANNRTGFGQGITDSVTILVSSQGKTKPVAPNTGGKNAPGRRRNRRVRFAWST